MLDAPGGTAAFRGFNMTVHIKRPASRGADPTTVHDNRVNALTTQLFLDDKNWIAVDNHTDVNGGPNAPRDGKIGTMYICWSFDGTGPTACRSDAADRRHALARRRQDLGRHTRRATTSRSRSARRR